MGGFITKRHNDVRDYLAHLLNEVCGVASIEPHLVQVTEGETTSTNREDAARLDLAATQPASVLRHSRLQC